MCGTQEWCHLSAQVGGHELRPPPSTVGKVLVFSRPLYSPFALMPFGRPIYACQQVQPAHVLVSRERYEVPVHG